MEDGKLIDQTGAGIRKRARGRSSKSALTRSRLLWLWSVVILVSQTTTKAAMLLTRTLRWLSGVRERDAGALYEALRNSYHFALFASFGWLLPSPRDRRAWALAVIVCILFSVTTELLQFWVVSRSPEVADALLNAAASTGALWWRSRSAPVTMDA